MYSKAPIIRIGHWAVLAVHSMYCRTGIRTSTYNRNFRVGMHELQLSFCMLNVDNALTWRAFVHQTFIFNLFQSPLSTHTGHIWLKLMLCKLQVQGFNHRGDRYDCG